MVNTDRTQSVRSRACTFLVILVSALLGFATRAEASPFTLTLMGSGSGGGGGSRPAGTTSGWSGSPLGLNLGGLAGPRSTSSGSRTINPSTTNPTTMLAPSQSLASDTAGTTVQSLTAVVRSSVASLPASGSLAQLALGNGETLSVSGPVVDSIVNSISGSTPVTSGSAPNTGQPSQPHTDGVSNDVIRAESSGTAPASNGDAVQDIHALPGAGNSTVDAGNNGGIPGSSVPDDMVQSVFTDVMSDIVSSPAAMTNPSLADVVAAADPISAAEPATLLLMASALTLGARRLRRRR
jgi:hypothetical protein